MSKWYTVTKVNDVAKPWNGPKGIVYYYDIAVTSDEDGLQPVSIGKQKEIPPMVGDQIYGHIENGTRLKRDQLPDGADLRPLNNAAPASNMHAAPYVPQAAKNAAMTKDEWSIKDDKIAFQNATNAAATLLQGTGDLKAWATFQSTIYAAYRKEFHKEAPKPAVDLLPEPTDELDLSNLQF